MAQPESDLNRVREVFEDALDVPTAERSAWLDARCGRDAALRAQVDELLRHEDEAEGFLSRPAALLAPDFDRVAEDWVGETFDGFVIRRLLARGGMGLVFEAEQASPRRAVALKTLRQRYGSEETRRRFRLEVEVLGLLRHPGIAQIHGAGTIVDGTEHVPYIAMELVEDARPITRFARERGLDEAALLELFCAVCDAVDHGHRKGIVHRDLKPGNVLVDRQGAAKVIDFGLARVVDPNAVGASLVETLHGALLGTLEYMSPEHVTGKPLDVDVRSDVYSLGCILFELLTGRAPRDFGDLPIPAAVQRLQSEDPEVPADLPREPRWILVKALERSPERRYAAASALADDVRRYLAHDSVLAVRPSALYQLQKFGRRHASVLLAAVAVTVALTIGLLRARSEADRARRAEVEARAAEQNAENRTEIAQAVGGFLSGLFKSSHAYRKGAEAKVVDWIETAAARLDGIEQPAARAILGSLVAEGLANVEQPFRAREVLEPAWDWMTRNLPPQDFDRIHAGAVRVDVLESVGAYREALDENLALLEVADEVLPTHHPDRFYLLQNRAVLHQRLGDPVAAERVYRELLDPAARIGVESEVNVRHKLAQTVAHQGRYADAETLYREAAALAESLGEESLYGTVIRMDLASTLRRLGQLDAAQALYHTCIEEFDARGGTPSNRFGVRQNLIALLFEIADRGRGADLDLLDDLADQVEAIATEFEKTPGRFRLAVLNVRTSLARLHEDFDRGIAYGEEALALSQQIYGEANPHALSLHSALALALELGGRMERSLEVLADADAILAWHPGVGSYPWRVLQRNRIRALDRAGRSAEGLELAQRLVEHTAEDAPDAEQNRQLRDALEARQDG